MLQLLNNYPRGINLLLSLPLIVVIVLIIILLRMFRKQWWFGVPFVRTKQLGIDVLVKHINITPGQIFVDLGCGDGIVMDAILRAHPGAITRGYELDPTVVAQSASYQQTYGSEFSIITGDYFQATISDANIVYCYLLPRLLPHVWKMITNQCASGTIVYSYVFPIPGIAADNEQVIQIPGLKSDTLYTYILS